MSKGKHQRPGLFARIKKANAQRRAARIRDARRAIDAQHLARILRNI